MFLCMMWIEMRMQYEMGFSDEVKNGIRDGVFDEVTLQKERKKELLKNC